MPRLKSLLLVGWSLWWTCVLATNLADAGKALGVLPASWPFASGNFDFIATTTARYGPPPFLNTLLFAAILLWEALATFLFWRAAWLHGSAAGRGAVHAAFAVGLSLWLAFIVACEVCMAYAVEQTHVHLLSAQLLTLLALELLPEQTDSR